MHAHFLAGQRYRNFKNLVHFLQFFSYAILEGMQTSYVREAKLAYARWLQCQCGNTMPVESGTRHQVIPNNKKKGRRVMEALVQLIRHKKFPNQKCVYES
jgi:hypothetical protein